MNALVEVTDLTKVFDVSAPWLNRVLEHKPRQAVHAVDGVSFAIAKGRTLALVGESGCGKSTVARMLVGLYAPTRGTIRFDGQDAQATWRGNGSRALRRRIQMIFQDPYASLNPRWTVHDIVAEPLREHALVRDVHALGERVSVLLEQVGLAAADRVKFPHQFSGGQRQRISIARAVVLRPEVLVLDEPTSALDASVQQQVLSLLVELQQRHGMSYVFISHDLAVIRAMSHRVLVMKDGAVVEDGEALALFDSPRHAYTRELIAAAHLA
ncbi:MAG: ABC transporter ATP-binding protein [Burkholderiaceae bacterium]|nr:ABC transporter ATP-binding protein [Burkholderiaceae bacterium]